MKISKPCTAGVATSDQTLWTFTYYVNDASGNVMATYDYERESAYYSMKLDEQMIYGSSRLGLRKYNNLLSTFTVSGSVLTHEEHDDTLRYLGRKRYEYTNHLGNVLLVTTDRKMSVDANSNGTTDYYHAVVDAYYDYGPFGNVLDGRSYGTGYRYGMNGQEHEDEIANANGAHYSAEYWMYDSRLGRRWNIDPIVKHHESPYAAFANNPIIFVDPNGADTVIAPNGEIHNAGDGYLPNEDGSILYGDGLKTKIWDYSEEKYIDAPKEFDEIVASQKEVKAGLNINFHIISYELTPNIYEFTYIALSTNPEWAWLTYLGPNNPQRDKNRRDAVKNCIACNSYEKNRDEFPYASTEEGGANAMCACVPARENSIQGGHLSVLYRNMEEGEKFYVVLKDLEEHRPKLRPVPVPYLLPEPKPDFKTIPIEDPYGGPIIPVIPVIPVLIPIPSDSTLKTDITIIDESEFLKLLSLNGYTYQWTTDSIYGMRMKDGADIGLIAQEVHKYFPEITDSISNEYLGVHYYKLIPIMIEVIKYENERIIELESIMNDQKLILEKQSELIDKLLHLHSKKETKN